MISRTLLCMSLMACQGLAGPVGSPGLDGTDGLNGVDGLNGEDGSQYWIIESDTTWSGDMDLWGTIWVKEGVSVTIEAGTRLFFRPGSFLAVQGALVSQGTVTLPIRFEGPSGMTQSQPEVLLTGDVAGASLDQFLASGVNFRVRGNGFDRLSNCTIERGNIHIANRTMPFLIDSCSLRPSAGSVQSAVEAQGVTELKIQDSDIEDANAGVIFWVFRTVRCWI